MILFEGATILYAHSIWRRGIATLPEESRRAGGIGCKWRGLIRRRIGFESVILNFVSILYGTASIEFEYLVALRETW